MQMTLRFQKILLAATLCLVSTLGGFAQAGWASKTAFRNAETQVQKKIVAAANKAAGKSSGVSIASPSQGWLTDAADGDGDKMITGINRYINWLKNPNGVSKTKLKQTIAADFANTNYSSSQRTKFADQITSMYGPFKSTIKAGDYNAALAFLGVRKQCLEWAMTLAIASGGRPKNYGAAEVTDSSRIRPGMALYTRNKSHAMIIVDVYWDAKGVPTKFKVAEANWGTGWSNPPGSVPWERIVQTKRDTLTLSGNKVVDYEAK